MPKVAVLGDSRGLLSRTLVGYDLQQVSLPSRGLRNRPMDGAIALCRPRAEWQAEFVKRGIKRSGSNVLLSLIDNVEYLGYCSDPDNGIRTIAIQNGLRLPWGWAPSIGKFHAMKKRNQFQHDIYVAWGDWDAERYLDLGGSAREMIRAGSLADAVHRAETKSIPENHLIGVLEMRNPRHVFFDLLPDPPRNTLNMSAWADNIRVLYSHLERFCRTEATQPLFVLNPMHEQASQIQLLDSLYSGPKKTHYDALNALASYDGVASCHVVVGVLSSLLVEVLGRGRKILAFNPSGNADLDFPVEGIWTLSDGRYEAFAERLRIIIEMSASEWKNEVRVVSRKLIAYNPEAPTEVVIRKLVDDLVTR